MGQMLSDSTGIWSGLDTLTTVGISIGMVALALTGVGAFIDIDIGLTYLSVGLGFAATTVDAYTCSQGESVGCAGAIVNGLATGLGLGGIAAVGVAGSADLAATTSVGFARALFSYVATGFGIDAYAAGLQSIGIVAILAVALSLAGRPPLTRWRGEFRSCP
jgi:hypothetical protein